MLQFSEIKILYKEEIQHPTLSCLVKKDWNEVEKPHSPA